MSSIKWPAWVLILDVVGTLLLALGLNGLFIAVKMPTASALRPG